MEIREKTYDSICRLCLNYGNSKTMVSLVDNNSQDGVSLHGKAVLTFANISLQKDDYLPRNMCSKCLLLLKQAIQFKFMCETSDKSLKTLKKYNNKTSDCLKGSIVEYTMFKFYFPDYRINPCKRKSSESIKHKIIHENVQNINKEDNMNENFSKNIFEDQGSCGDSLEKMEGLCNGSTSSVNIPIKKTQEDLYFRDFSVKKQSQDFGDNLIDNLNNSGCKIVINNSEIKNALPALGEENLRNNFNNDFIKDSDAENYDEILDKMEMLIGGCLPTDLNNMQTLQPRRKILKRKVRCRKKQMQALTPHLKRRKKPRTVDTNRGFTCNVCNRVLANQLTYDHHMQRHNGCRFICEHCGKGFPVLNELQIHQVTRHGTGPYLQCSRCDFKAPRKFDLVEHERIHTGERPYTCDKCGLTFRRRGIWRKHLIYHTEKKYQCPQCPRKFYQRSEMLAHANNIHDRVYFYCCSKCGATYTKTATVRRHMTDRHGIPREMQGKIIRINKKVICQE